CILVSLTILVGCNNHESKLDDFLKHKLFGFLFVYDIYGFVNDCPPKNGTLNQGINTIHLNEGEAYWFDINTTSEPYLSDSKDYYIGFNALSGQSLDIGSSGCYRNRQLSHPTYPQKPGGLNPSTKYKDGFWMYLITFNGNGLGNVLSKSGSGSIQIKVP
ncbi:MAG: hypothetical protein KDK90_28525, partial [Leptospiraceae bacterium]|nr:hypothetical protein [Leptospiraceae bacterium]